MAATAGAASVHHVFRTARWLIPLYIFGVHMSYALFARYGSVMIPCWVHPAERPVRIEIQTSSQELAIRITDEGGGPPDAVSETPDLLAKLAGDQSPRGWGLFLIQNMVDEMNVTKDEQFHTIELVLNLETSQ
jgi:hypothetical protein